jgi:photosystem II stability/assembly factor-like uncharacterized protein
MANHAVRRPLVLSTATLLALAVSVPASTADTAPLAPSTSRSSAPSVSAPLAFGWEPLASGTFGNVVALDVTPDGTIWASTSDTSEVMRSTDGGESFSNVAPPEGSEEFLQFYDIEAISADEAIVLSSGTGELSRVYHTLDGGESWHETYRATNPSSFINCIAMFDKMRGFAVGDSIDGKYQIITTANGGHTWQDVPPEAIPDAQDGEYEWAASGTCANATGRTGWFGTGNAPEARIIWTDDFGASWNASATPMPSGLGAGIMGVDFRTNNLGLAVGGDFGTGAGAVIRSTDGGASWSLVEGGPTSVSTGIAWWQDKKGDERMAGPSPEQKTVFVVGGGGSYASTDLGLTWTNFDFTALNTVTCLKRTPTCVAGGGGGTLMMLTSD